MANIPVYKSVLNRCRPNLIDDMEIESMIDYIISKEILPQSKTDDIKDEKNLRSEKKRKLIESIAAAGEDAYRIFLKGLKQTKQTYLWQMLNKFEKEETEKRKACAESGTPGAAETLTSTASGLFQQETSDIAQDRNKEASKTKDTDNGQPFEPNDKEDEDGSNVVNESSGVGTIQETMPPTESEAGFKDVQEWKSESSLASVDKANNSNSQAAPRESTNNTSKNGSGEASVPNAKNPAAETLTSTASGLFQQATSDIAQDRNKEASKTKDTDNGQPFGPNDKEDEDGSNVVNESSGVGTIQETMPPTESEAGFKDVQEWKSESSLASVDKANNSNSQAAPRESTNNTSKNGSGEASVPNAKNPGPVGKSTLDLGLTIVNSESDGPAQYAVLSSVENLDLHD